MRWHRWLRYKIAKVRSRLGQVDGALGTRSPVYRITGSRHVTDMAAIFTVCLYTANPGRTISRFEMAPHQCPTGRLETSGPIQARRTLVARLYFEVQRFDPERSCFRQRE